MHSTAKSQSWIEIGTFFVSIISHHYRSSSGKSMGMRRYRLTDAQTHGTESYRPGHVSTRFLKKMDAAHNGIVKTASLKENNTLTLAVDCSQELEAYRPISIQISVYFVISISIIQPVWQFLTLLSHFHFHFNFNFNFPITLPTYQPTNQPTTRTHMFGV